MKHKRFLSAILGICLLQTAAVPKISAESNKITTTVVYENDEDKAVCFLEGLGVDTGFKNEETVTRGQFTSLLMNVAFDEQFTPSNESVFDDVPKDYEYYNDIYFAYNEQIVSKNNLFRPMDNIKFAEAVTMAITALGYGFIAKDDGGYPYGYTKCASNIGLSKHIYSASDDELSGEEVLLLLYNMIGVDFMVQNFSQGGASYSVKSNSNILTSRYKLKKISGLVTATEYSDLSGESSVKDGNIKIDGVNFEFDGDSIDLLGMRVTAYVNSDGKAVIVCPANNKILEVDKAENCITDGSTVTAIEVENGSSTKTIKLDSAYSYIYNGAAYNASMAQAVADLTGVQGHIKLVDNNGDGKYDVVFVYNVEYMEVGQLDYVGGKIYGAIYGGASARNSISFDEESHIRFYNGETEIEPYDIQSGDVLAIMIARNRADGTEVKVGRAEIVKNDVYGTVEMVDTDIVVIGGVEFKRNSCYNPAVGTTAVFKIGILNDIISGNVNDTRDYRYGYLIKTKLDRRTDTHSLRIFTEDGEFVKYDCAEKVNLNGTRVRPARDWVTSVEPLLYDPITTNFKRQLVRYKVKEGYITAIDTIDEAIPAKGLKQTVNDSSDSLLRYYNGIVIGFKTNTGNKLNSFMRFPVNAQTLIFQVPAGGIPASISKNTVSLTLDTATMNVEDADFGIMPLSLLKNDTKDYVLDAYDLDENGVPKVIVLYGNATTFSETYGVVDKISSIWHEDFGSVREVRIWKSRDECSTYYLENEKINLIQNPASSAAPAGELTAGDIIRFTERNGILQDIKRVFDANHMGFTIEAASNELNGAASAISTTNIGAFKDAIGTTGKYSYASIYKKSGDTIIFTTTKNPDGTWNYSLPNLLSTTLYDTAAIILVENNKVKRIYQDEIRDYYSAGGAADEIVLNQGYWFSGFIVIYR
ncbi:MAG: hypothetical protein K5768_04870 [Firmicutes bacterium]|nr:hypothetical protein [Bacillota bacterium]